MKFTHGGKRRGAGRKSAFAQKASEKPIAMCFTPAGHRQLRRLQRASRLSRNGVIGTLAAAFARQVTFTEKGVAYPGKAKAVLSIRLPRLIGREFRLARARTGKSYSDIGERLVREYGDIVRIDLKRELPSIDIQEPDDLTRPTIEGNLSGVWNS